MKKLKLYLIDHKISQAQFGLLIGVTQVAINSYLTGRRFPEPTIILKIEEVTNGHVTPSDWYDEYRTKNSNLTL